MPLIQCLLWVSSSLSLLYHLGGWLRPEAAVALPLPLRAARVSLLNGRALDVAIRTIHTAITFIGLEHCTTALAFIEKLTRVRRHQFSLRVTAFWAGDCRVQLHRT